MSTPEVPGSPPGVEGIEALLGRLANEVFGRLGPDDVADEHIAWDLPSLGVGLPGHVAAPPGDLAPVHGYAAPSGPLPRTHGYAAPSGPPSPGFAPASAAFAPPSQGVAPPVGHGAPDGSLPYYLGLAGVSDGVAPVLVPAEAAPAAAPTRDGFDAALIRRQFPILDEVVHGRRLIWLDNAATTQKPTRVIDRISHYYRHENSNIHRAAHTLAARATDAFEHAREVVKDFVGAGSANDIVFVRGATEGINLLAGSWGAQNLHEGDEIILSTLEHHSNIVPWQLLAQRTGARLRVIPVDDRGVVDLDAYERLLGPRTRLVSITHVSNALGTVVPVSQIAASAHRHGACVIVDGAQSISHFPVNVQTLGADFFVFSGHKIYGPTGIGAVWGRPEAWARTPPWQGGGNMIEDVRFERTVYAGPPARFEAGTPNIADAVGLGAALEWLSELGMENVARHEHDLLVYGTERLQEIAGLKLVGTAPEKAGVLSFVLEGRASGEIGAALDREGIAVRAGHHCAQPALRRFGLEASVRPSLGVYNTREDIDALVAAILKIRG